MLKLFLTLINKKSVATHLSILLLETAASKMRNWNGCKTRADYHDGPNVKEQIKNFIFNTVYMGEGTCMYVY